MPSIAVRDFGPIAHAEIELKPLTVLIGANNTGKSYLALAIYSLLRGILGHPPGYAISEMRGGPTRFWASRREGPSLSDVVGDLTELKPVLERLSSKEATFGELPPPVRQWIQDQSKTWADFLADDVEYELRRCFGSSLDQLGRRSHYSQSGEFGISISDESHGLSWDMCSADAELTTQRWEADLSRFSPTISGSRLPLSDLMLHDPEFLGHVLLAEYSEFVIRSYATPSFYIPATRSGILLGHRTLASLIVGRASRGWIEPMEIGRLPGVITDLIQALLILEEGEPASPEISKTVEFLESEVVTGTIEIQRRLEYPDISYNTNAGEFRLHEVSSMVAETAALVLFLKFLVHPGHLFIFEEPESHLDAANQRRLARAIAMLVNAGVRVLVTTHSDIFLRQINNLMQVAKNASARQGETEYSSAEVLESGQVAAYIFQPGSVGTYVEPLPLDPEYGISTESFSQVHRALYDEAVMMEHLD